MADTFEQSMNKTMSDFQTKVLPILQRFYEGCKFVEIEGRADDEITQDFDIYAGIDAYRVYKSESEMIGIASRIQRGRNWKTFTVRESRESGAATEYAKRKNAIKKGLLYPTLTLQAYIDGENIVIGICRTVDLIEYIERYHPSTKCTGYEQNGRASFYVCHWDDMKRRGYQVRVIDNAIMGQNKSEICA